MARKRLLTIVMVEDGVCHRTAPATTPYIRLGNKIHHPRPEQRILHGITRAAVLRFAKEAQMVVEERNFTIHEAQQRIEAFTTSAGAFVMPVVEIAGVALVMYTGPGRAASTRNLSEEMPQAAGDRLAKGLPRARQPFSTFCSNAT